MSFLARSRWENVFITRDSYASRLLAMAWASVICLSVRVSVTHLSPIKTVHARITKSLLWAAPRL